MIQKNVYDPLNSKTQKQDTNSLLVITTVQKWVENTWQKIRQNVDIGEIVGDSFPFVHIYLCFAIFLKEYNFFPLYVTNEHILTTVKKKKKIQNEYTFLMH